MRNGAVTWSVDVGCHALPSYHAASRQACCSFAACGPGWLARPRHPSSSSSSCAVHRSLCLSCNIEEACACCMFNMLHLDNAVGLTCKWPKELIPKHCCMHVCIAEDTRHSGQNAKRGEKTHRLCLDGRPASPPSLPLRARRPTPPCMYDPEGSTIAQNSSNTSINRAKDVPSTSKYLHGLCRSTCPLLGRPSRHSRHSHAALCDRGAAVHAEDQSVPAAVVVSHDLQRARQVHAVGRAATVAALCFAAPRRVRRTCAHWNGLHSWDASSECSVLPP